MSSGQANAEVGVDSLVATLTTLHEAPIAAYVVNALTANGVGTCGADDNQAQAGHLLPIAFSAKDHGADATFDLSPTLRAGGHNKSHANAGVMPAVAFSIMPMNSGTDYKARETDPRAGIGVGQSGDPMFTLQAGAQHGVATFDLKRGLAPNGSASESDIAFPLTASDYKDPQLVRIPAVCATGEVFHTLRAEGFDASEDGTGRGGGAVATAMRVRRLTPTECERLQGFPDGWTQVPYRGKPASDGPRYKAIGNSMAVPVMAWIGRRIQAVSEALA